MKLMIAWIVKSTNESIPTELGINKLMNTICWSRQTAPKPGKDHSRRGNTRT